MTGSPSGRCGRLTEKPSRPPSAQCKWKAAAKAMMARATISGSDMGFAMPLAHSAGKSSGFACRPPFTNTAC